MVENDNIKELYARAKKAAEAVEFWSQERVDEVVAAVAWKWMSEEVGNEVARIAAESSGMGNYEHKTMKAKKVRGCYLEMRDAKTAGIIREDKDRKYITYGKPIGVVANVVPCTNPGITTKHIGLSLLKTRNACIVSPHPRTKLATYRVVQWGRAVLKALNAPEDLMLCIQEPSNEKTVELMQTCDFAVATGGKALIKVVHAAGTPAITVGAGNVRTIIDPSADPKHVAYCVHKSKTFDNSTSCSSENAISVHVDCWDAVMKELKAVGGHMLNDDEREKLKNALWPDGRTLNRDMVASHVQNIAKHAGITVPENTAFLMVMGKEIGPSDPFSGEKLSLTLTVWKWSDFETELKHLRKNLEYIGIGHSACIHSMKPEQWHRMAEFIPTGRINVNAPNTKVNSGSWYAAQEFTTTLACGQWQGNSSTENINYKHFLQETRMCMPYTDWVSCDFREHIPTDEEVWGKRLKFVKEKITPIKLGIPFPKYEAHPNSKYYKFPHFD
ncbi:MAG: aldehyde dehydrogenase family protein [Spirochaetes bacterium]|nr:aldehyde dehydrogenase family protein [Spirochaetota bacterium]